jgi:hypothetical protein
MRSNTKIIEDKPARPKAGDVVSDREGNKFLVFSPGLRYLNCYKFPLTDRNAPKCLIKISDVFVVSEHAEPPKTAVVEFDGFAVE